MPLDRRQFFRRLIPGDKTTEQRLARYETLEAYVRNRLLPYDFSLSEAQERELMESVRAFLEPLSNKELFSVDVQARLEQLAEPQIQAWRLLTDVSGRASRIHEVRCAASGYVGAFLTVQAGTAIIDQLQHNYGVDDPNELEPLLKRQIEIWIEDVDDRLIEQYDVASVQELVFAQLRSWC
jgi:hypothetical protein